LQEKFPNTCDASTTNFKDGLTVYWIFLCFQIVRKNWKVLIGIFQHFWELTVRIYKRIFEMLYSVGLALNDKFFLDPSTSFTEHHQSIGQHNKDHSLWHVPNVYDHSQRKA
jgi:hypothetical protein